MGQLVKALVTLACIWLMVAFGVGEPLDEQKLIGRTRQQIRVEFGEPDATRAIAAQGRGDIEWTYYTGLVLQAATHVEFKDGIAVHVTGSSPNK